MGKDSQAPAILAQFLGRLETMESENPTTMQRSVVENLEKSILVAYFLVRESEFPLPVAS